VEVWELNLNSYASVKAFAERAKGLERLDVVVENAAVFKFDYATAEDNEQSVTVNVVCTFLLALLLLPKLRETANRFGRARC
jgi:NAD(P)-dependent dehydrogenase (short-subunit alcohol dehydrogenase family)